MKEFVDNRLITKEEFSRVVQQYLSRENLSADCSGAGSDCAYIEYNGRIYAVLSKRKQPLGVRCMQNISKIINNRSLCSCIGWRV